MPRVNSPDRRFEKKQFRIRILFDMVSILGAWFLSYLLRFYVLPGGIVGKDTFGFFISISSVSLVSTYLIMYYFGLYEKNISRRSEFSGLLKVSFAEFCIMVVFYYYFFQNKISRMHLAIYMICLFLLLIIGRSITNTVLAKISNNGKYDLNVLLVGSGTRLNNYYKAITKDRAVNRLKVVGQYLSEGSCFDGVSPIEADSLENAIEKACADIVVISLHGSRYSSEDEIIRQSLNLFKQQVYVIPNIPDTFTGADLSEIRKVPVIQLNYSEMSFASRFIKRTFDIVSCSLGVLVLSPLYILLAIMVKISSKGPVFFRQKRVTKDGKVFEMLKFRSMRTDMPEGDAHWTTEDDPRVTKIGKFLRKTSLDELPQFFNVISGDMSLIGPRPERPELEEVFVKTIPGYYHRHRMKAGITGWAQVNGLRGNTSLEKRIEFDLYYIRNWSVSFDIKVFLLTFFKGFVNKNAY